MVRAAVLTTDGRFRLDDVPDTLEAWQGLVEGLVAYTPATALVSPRGTFVIIYNDDGNPGLHPNLWGLVLGGPLLGTVIVTLEDRHDHKVDLSDAEIGMLSHIQEHLHNHLVDLGLIPAATEPTVISWDGAWPGDFRPAP